MLQTVKETWEDPKKYLEGNDNDGPYKTKMPSGPLVYCDVHLSRVKDSKLIISCEVL